MVQPKRNITRSKFEYTPDIMLDVITFLMSYHYILDVIHTCFMSLHFELLWYTVYVETVDTL